MNLQSKSEVFHRLRLLDDYSIYRPQGGYMLGVSGKQPSLLQGESDVAKHLRLPALIIYDHPAHHSVSDLQQVFMTQPGNDEMENRRLKHCLNDFSGLSPSGHLRYYQLVAFLEDDPQMPVAFINFNISLQDFWYYEEQPCTEDKIGVCCHALHTFVVPHLRELGIAKALHHQMANLFWNQLQHVSIQLEESGHTVCPIIFRGIDAMGAEPLLNDVIKVINQYELVAKSGREMLQQSISNL